MAKAALGKGLSALMGSAPAAAIARPEPDAERGESVRQIERARIVPSPLQPRKMFRPEELAEMVDSIRERGVIQPLIVREVAGKFELIAGERRWRASGEAGLETLPAIVRHGERPRGAGTRADRKSAAGRSQPDRGSRGLRAPHSRIFRSRRRTSRSRSAKAASRSRTRCGCSCCPNRFASWLGSNDLSVGHAKVLLGLATADEQLLAAENASARTI